MKGYIFEYYKYIQYFKESLDDIKNLLASDSENSILTFGEYDRLKITSFTKFDRFRDLSTLARNWIGNRQSILLYDLLEEPEFIYVEEPKNLGKFKERKTGEFDKHLIWALTEFQFRSELRNSMTSYKDFLLNIKKSLDEILLSDVNLKDYKYMVLGTLGTFGIAVLWFTNQYVDVLKAVDTIKRKSTYLDTSINEKNEKNEKKGMYLAAHTIFSKNPFYNEIYDDPLIDKIEGKAFLQITLKKWIKDFQTLIKSDIMYNVNHTSGEYDIIAEMNAKDVFKNFEKLELFNHDKDEYQKNFIQTKITFANLTEKYKLPEKSPFTGSSSNNELPEKSFTGSSSNNELPEKSFTGSSNNYNDLAKNVGKVAEEYENLRDFMKGNINKKSGLVDVLDSLHCDYRYNVASAVNQSWAEDFSYIFLKNLECIREVIQLGISDSYNSSYKEQEDIMPILRTILNNLKQQIFHISEANNLDFELPKCHLRYTGQEDQILFAYMGIIKNILETAYQLKSQNMQTEIVPIVTVDAVPIIESELYFDQSAYGFNWDSKDQKFKILSLNLPHVAFYDISTSIQYLHHEIYHYIVPEDRETRDYVLGSLIAVIYFQSFIENILEEFFIDEQTLTVDKALLVSVNKYIQEVVYDIVVQNYSEIHKILTKFHIKNRNFDMDKVLLLKKVYIGKLIEYFRNSSCLFDWIKELYNRMSSKADVSFYDLKSQFQMDQKKVQKIESFEKYLKQFENYKKQPWQIIWIYEKNEGIIDSLVAGLEEVSADIPMIEICHMNLSYYMILYAQCLNNKMIKPEKNNIDREFDEFIRLGVTLHFYEIRGESLEKTKENFLYLYVAKYCGENGNITTINKYLKEAMDWFDYFQLCWEKYKNLYWIYEEYLRKLLDIYSIRDRKVKNQEEEYYCYLKQYYEIFENFSNVIKEVINPSNEKTIWERYEEERKNLDKKIFNLNIELINFFQKQKSLSELCEINEKANTSKRQNTSIQELSSEAEFSLVPERFFKKGKGPSIIYDLKDFFAQINNITNELEESCYKVFGKNNLPLWYRGQENSTRGLLPNIMRNYNEERRYYNYLSHYQQHLLEEFKYRTDGSPELVDNPYCSISYYLALMQHYGVYTTLMDWSEDAFTGLYFALESLITHKTTSLNRDASIFVFSPHLYNEARRYMMNYIERTEPTLHKDKEEETLYNASIGTANYNDMLIPNFSTSYNEKKYDMFLIGNSKYELEKRYGYDRNISLEEADGMAYLPMAIYMSKLNHRIKSQSGIFVAYNLYAKPCSGIDTYSYMELEKIQEYYLEKCNRKNKQAFLYKLVIEKNAAKNIAECLIRMGISKERIYPELSNIGERIK